VRLSAVVLAALALVACGESDDDSEDSPAPEQAEVRASVQRLYAAAVAQDGGAMCRALTPALRRRLARGAGGCGSEALVVVLGPGPPRNTRVTGVRITGDSARAQAQAIRGHGAAERTDRVRVQLERVGGRWLVAATERVVR
jgi:hypothetical protein